MPTLRAVVDVPDLELGISFYTAAFELSVVRKMPGVFVELGGTGTPIDLVQKDAGGSSHPTLEVPRRYQRHWTPVHLDFVVTSLDATVERCVSLGAKLEVPVSEKKWGRIAILADPFGHGLCVIEFRGRGYDEVL